MTTDLTSLAAISLGRAGLPTFAGASLPEQLMAGHDAALAVLRKYVPDLAFDPAGASTTLRQVEAWADRNADSLAAVLGSASVSALPDQLQLTFGADKAQAFIVAMFTQASLGLGPWLSGRVDTEVQSGQVIQSQWARADADTRLQVFGGIVKMDADGHLATIFVAPASGANGLGLLPPLIVWAIVIAVVALAAVLVVYLYNAKRLELNNKTMSDLCARAQAAGDTATVQKCIDAAAGLQKENPFGGAEDLLRRIGTTVLVTGVLYVLVRYGLPVLAERGAQRRGYMQVRRSYA